MSYIPSPATFKNLIELSEVFQDEIVCRKYLEHLLWDNEPICPKCGNKKVYRFPDQKRFKCANNTCYKIFTITVGTYFESTKIPLRKWLHGIYVFTSHKKGISSCQLAKDISVTQKTAWFILSRLREVLKEKSFTFDRDEITQIDETYYSGKAENRHANAPLIKTSPIIGFSGSNGQTSFVHVKSVHHKNIKKLIQNRIEKGSTMVTDGHTIYKFLAKEYQHRFVDHQSGEYVNGEGYHTNSIEGAFSHLKRGIVGIYHHVSPKHLQKYCNEFAFRLSTRKISERNRFDYAITQCSGRLKYKDLTAVGEFSRYPVADTLTPEKRFLRRLRKERRDAKYRN